MSGEVVTEYGGRQLVSRDLDMMFCLKSHWGAAGKVLYRDLQSHVKVGTANPSEGAQPAPGAFVLDGKPNHPGMAHDLAANLGTHRCMSLSDVFVLCRCNLLGSILFLSGRCMHMSDMSVQA
jgi:hypothetical protein